MNPLGVFRPIRPFVLSQNLVRMNRIQSFSSSASRLDIGEQKESLLDRDKMDTQSTEGSKTGGDSSAASEHEAAYNPDITQPQSEKDEAGKGNEHNPLDASGSNPELGKPTEEEESGAGKKTK